MWAKKLVDIFKHVKLYSVRKRFAIIFVLMKFMIFHIDFISILAVVHGSMGDGDYYVSQYI